MVSGSLFQLSPSLGEGFIWLIPRWNLEEGGSFPLWKCHLDLSLGGRLSILRKGCCFWQTDFQGSFPIATLFPLLYLSFLCFFYLYILEGQRLQRTSHVSYQESSPARTPPSPFTESYPVGLRIYPRISPANEILRLPIRSFDHMTSNK